MKHTPEPWRLDGWDIWEANNRDSGYTGICAFDATRTDLAMANLRRIVACVNFCTGIPTEDLKPGGLAELRRDDADKRSGLRARIAALEAENARLVAKLEVAADAYSTDAMKRAAAGQPEAAACCRELEQQARAAIALVRKEKQP